MSIGVVLERVREEFPEVTVSKIRFLESEGLITPQRTASGYRRFTDDDVERLRFILTTQRDNYLPLKVIREQLDAMDAGHVAAVMTPAAQAAASSPVSLAVQQTRVTAADLAAQAQCEETFLAELVKAGIITPDASGFFTADDVASASAAHKLHESGLSVSHLKRVKTAAQRQADVITSAAGAQSGHGRSADAKQAAEESAAHLTSLVINLHSVLVKAAVRADVQSS
ncbi:MerR family transcriptional regulator [Corynebacterium tapiri]|uniref:MerR family transcriptional regulator n=1 Tax=Corynebacterium tapiri TaxID=1448266 RepID=A0A5C4U4T4_9CORY|nr:MerR family transcriptional regulator [Corynebacterium tapiri]TNL97675.1 MerR family transcriptional regulator [Corynebacterium tapiri]